MTRKTRLQEEMYTQIKGRELFEQPKSSMIDLIKPFIYQTEVRFLARGIDLTRLAMVAFIEERDHGKRTSAQNRRDIQYPVCPVARGNAQKIQMGYDSAKAS